MNFQTALSLMQAGYYTTRFGWDNKKLYVRLYNTQKFIIKLIDKGDITWTPSTEDLLAQDWRIFEL